MFKISQDRPRYKQTNKQTYLYAAYERHILALYDFEVHGSGWYLWYTSKLHRYESFYSLTNQPWRAVTFGLHRIGHGEVLQPGVQLQEVAVTMPPILVERQVPEKQQWTQKVNCRR
jgi:hypothetical protein